VRVTVVGGGVIGLLTAVECVLAGARVTVLDQAELPHPASTSFDRHKMMRAVHPDDPAATRAAVRAHRRWLELERLLSARFYDRVGALTVLPVSRLPQALSVLWNTDAPATALEHDDLVARYPHLRWPAGTAAVLERDAGALLADRVLAACAGWLRCRPEAATLLPWHRVVDLDGDTAEVTLAGGDTIAADRLLVAAGPWSQALVPAADAGELTLFRQTMLLCDVPPQRRDDWADTPVIPSFGLPSGAWLVPPVAGTPLKLSADLACRAVAELGEPTDDPGAFADALVEVFTGLVPEFTADWVTETRECHYLADTGTGGPRAVPLGAAAIGYAACGGGSFKLAPVIATDLAARLTGGRPEPTGLPTLDRLDPLDPIPVPHAV
jgi:sarcosine oxidase